MYTFIDYFRMFRLFWVSMLMCVGRMAIAQGTYPNPLQNIGVTTLPQFFAKVLDGFSLLLMPLVVIFIIYAGYLFVTAQGEESRIQKARTALWWTIIGTGVIIGARLMANILSDTLSQLNQV